MPDATPPQPPQQNAFGVLLGLRIDRTEAGVCEAHLETRPEHFNPHGVMHGGVLFSLADTSMGAALYPLLRSQESCATIEVKMNFLKPVTEGKLRCETVVLRRGKTTAVLESKLHSGESLVGIALGTYAIFPRPA
ncbi:MAG TPA: PaaI family thioesterase [bacterium]|nr:PaaI family thioesterase [bacterium]